MLPVTGVYVMCDNLLRHSKLPAYLTKSVSSQGLATVGTIPNSFILYMCKTTTVCHFQKAGNL